MMKQKLILHTEALMRYLLKTDEEMDTLVNCNPDQFDFETTVPELYEALGSIYPDEFVHNRLVKLLEAAKLQPGERPATLTHDRVDALRAAVLKKGQEGRATQ